MAAVATWDRLSFRGDMLPQATAAPTGTVGLSWTGTKKCPVVVQASASDITCAGVDLPWIRGEFVFTLQQETSVGSTVFNDVAYDSGQTHPIRDDAISDANGDNYGPTSNWIINGLVVGFQWAEA